MRIDLSLNQAALVLRVLCAVDAKLKPDEEGGGELELSGVPAIAFSNEDGAEFRTAVDIIKEAGV